MEDFSIRLANPESIYVEPDLNLVRDKFSVKLYLSKCESVKSLN